MDVYVLVRILPPDVDLECFVRYVQHDAVEERAGDFELRSFFTLMKLYSFEVAPCKRKEGWEN